MAPWAYTGKRISLDEIDGTFDVFPLGKVLWVMLSGEQILPLWYYEKPDHNLEREFPDNADMRLANAILARCVVERKDECVSSAGELVKVIDEALIVLRRGGELLRSDLPRACRVCGSGIYGLEDQLAHVDLSGSPFMGVAYVCNACGHLQIFRAPGGKLGRAWRSGS